MLSPTQAQSAGAVKGHVIFLKKDGEKLERRELYLVIDASEDSVSICKLPAALSGDTTIQFQPHNIQYNVKQTDIFLAPNQPVLVEEQHHYVPEHTHSYDHVPDDDLLEAELYSPLPKAKIFSFEEEDDEFEDIEEIQEHQTGTDTSDNSDDSDIDDDDPATEPEKNSEDNRHDDDPVTEPEENPEDNRLSSASPGSIESSDDLHQGAGRADHEEDSADDEQEGDSAPEDSGDDSDVGTDDEEVTNKDDNPKVLPNVGARIQFRYPETNIIQKATVMKMHRTMQYQWPGWRNVQVDRARKQSSVNLDIVSHLCVMWEYLDDIPPVPRAPGDGYIPQIDGNYTLPSGPSYKDYSEAFTANEPDRQPRPSFISWK